MVMREALELGRSRAYDLLCRIYSTQVAEFLLEEPAEDVDDRRPEAAFRRYDELIAATKLHLEKMTSLRR